MSQLGQSFESFFVGGDGEGEEWAFTEASGFSTVSDELVLGYVDGLPDSYFGVAEGMVDGWGGCTPTLVSGDAVASRFVLARDQEHDAARLEIWVESGRCGSGGPGQPFTSEVASVDVAEFDDHVELVVYTRQLNNCGIGVGGSFEYTVELDAPLSRRDVLNTGFLPAVEPDTRMLRGVTRTNFRVRAWRN